MVEGMNYSGSDPYKLEELKHVKQPMNDHHTKVIQDSIRHVKESRELRKEMKRIKEGMDVNIVKFQELVKQFNELKDK